MNMGMAMTRENSLVQPSSVATHIVSNDGVYASAGPL